MYHCLMCHNIWLSKIGLIIKAILFICPSICGSVFPNSGLYVYPNELMSSHGSDNFRRTYRSDQSYGPLPHLPKFQSWSQQGVQQAKNSIGSQVNNGGSNFGGTFDLGNYDNSYGNNGNFNSYNNIGGELFPLSMGEGPSNNIDDENLILNQDFPSNTMGDGFIGGNGLQAGMQNGDIGMNAMNLMGGEMSGMNSMSGVNQMNEMNRNSVNFGVRNVNTASIPQEKSGTSQQFYGTSQQAQISNNQRPKNLNGDNCYGTECYWPVTGQQSYPYSQQNQQNFARNGNKMGQSFGMLSNAGGYGRGTTDGLSMETGSNSGYTAGQAQQIYPTVTKGNTMTTGTENMGPGNMVTGSDGSTMMGTMDGQIYGQSAGDYGGMYGSPTGNGNTGTWMNTGMYGNTNMYGNSNDNSGMFGGNNINNEMYGNENSYNNAGIYGGNTGSGMNIDGSTIMNNNYGGGMMNTNENYGGGSYMGTNGGQNFGTSNSENTYGNGMFNGGGEYMGMGGRTMNNGGFGSSTGYMGMGMNGGNNPNGNDDDDDDEYVAIGNFPPSANNNNNFNNFGRGNENNMFARGNEIFGNQNSRKGGDRNIQEYSEYLDLINKKYGIEKPSLGSAKIPNGPQLGSTFGNTMNIGTYGNSNSMKSTPNPSELLDLNHPNQLQLTGGNENGVPTRSGTFASISNTNRNNVDSQAAKNTSPIICPAEETKTETSACSSSPQKIHESAGQDGTTESETGTADKNKEKSTLESGSYSPQSNNHYGSFYRSRPDGDKNQQIPGEYFPSDSSAPYGYAGTNSRQIVDERNAYGRNVDSSAILPNQGNQNKAPTFTQTYTTNDQTPNQWIVRQPGSKERESTILATTSAVLATTTSITPPLAQTSTTSVQALTQQIRRLPAVLYLDSNDNDSRRIETLLRDTYGLPLVSFYVDKIDKPEVVEKNLHQLTAHNGLPYLFICGTFIGTQEHVDNYHKNKQISQLVEYVCGRDKDESVVVLGGGDKTNKSPVGKKRRKKKKHFFSWPATAIVSSYVVSAASY